MADKSADIQTLAPRLSYVEDLVAWLSDEAVYKPMFRWNDTISASVKGSDPAKLYGTEITRAIKKLNGG